MKRIISLSIIFSVVFFLACNKDSANTTPSLTLKSFTPEVIEIGSDAFVTLKFTDKEGDIDSLTIIRARLNKKVVATKANDTTKYHVPDYQKSASGDMEIELLYQNHLIAAVNPPKIGNVYESDSLIFKFVALDKAKNHSDTISSSLVVVKRTQ